MAANHNTVAKILAVAIEAAAAAEQEAAAVARDAPRRRDAVVGDLRKAITETLERHNCNSLAEPAADIIVNFMDHDDQLMSVIVAQIVSEQRARD